VKLHVLCLHGHAHKHQHGKENLLFHFVDLILKSETNIYIIF
jgi:hypothetical protein